MSKLTGLPNFRTTASIPRLNKAARWAPFCFYWPLQELTMQGKSDPGATFSRRTVIKTAAAAGGAAAAGMWPLIASAQGAALETKAAKLGFIALTDAAPLFVADEKGYFKKHGMTEVEVLKQSSWGTTRDNLVLGSKSNGIDGAHILTPMPYLITTGAVTANN